MIVAVNQQRLGAQINQAFD